jgi:hypothetical protein
MHRISTNQGRYGYALTEDGQQATIYISTDAPMIVNGFAIVGNMGLSQDAHGWRNDPHRFALTSNDRPLDLDTTAAVVGVILRSFQPAPVPDEVAAIDKDIKSYSTLIGVRRMEIESLQDKINALHRRRDVLVNSA